MTIALLALITFILLFGAGAVKGFLMNTASLVVGFVILVGLVLWLGSFFGEDGPMYVVIGGGALLVVLAIWVGASKPIVDAPVEKQISRKPVPRFHAGSLSREEKEAIRRKLRGL